jgi:hypothetical protein
MLSLQSSRLSAFQPGPLPKAEIIKLQIGDPRVARQDKMHNAYIIEIGDEAVAIAARDVGGFRLHAALRACSGLDGRLFPSLGEATRAARAAMNGRNWRAVVRDGGGPDGPLTRDEPPAAPDKRTKRARP